jgi:tripartite-type tricarboxylate transporter receptor subunit TctC
MKTDIFVRVALLLIGLTALPLAAADRAPDRQSALPVNASYPERPVRFIVPFPPGGSDTVARMIGQKLGEKFGQQFVIDNRAGAGGTLGAAIAAKAPADGYTILFATASFAICPTIRSGILPPSDWSQAAPCWSSCIRPCRLRQSATSLHTPGRNRMRSTSRRPAPARLPILPPNSSKA